MDINNRELQTGREIIIREIQDAQLRLIDLMGTEKYQKWIFKEGKRIKKKFPDAENYALWNILVGGSYSGQESNWDFFGEDSVRKIIQKQIESCEK